MDSACIDGMSKEVRQLFILSPDFDVSFVMHLTGLHFVFAARFKLLVSRFCFLGWWKLKSYCYSFPDGVFFLSPSQ